MAEQKETTLHATTNDDIKQEVCRMQDAIEEINQKKRHRLKEMDFFCLDNSIRESTVGQLRHHTVENKVAIFEQVKRCGIKDIIVAAFSNMPRVDDSFCQFLVDRNEDFTNLYSFSEATGTLKDGVYDTETLPTALLKNKKYGIGNVILEVDLADKQCDWDKKFTIADICELLTKRIQWVKNNIREDGRNFLNLRDLPFAMTVAPERVLNVVKYLAQLPDSLKLFGLCFEEPLGECLPEELEAWTACLRRVMNANGWEEGKLLVHIHEKWELGTASQLDCLSAGADGVWASLCMEGAAVGHACSTVTMMNLVRLGNQKVLKKYNCTELRSAAIEVTKLTTGKMPHPKQCVYGERAADLVFESLGVGNFDIAKFFGVPRMNRISSSATPKMIVDRLVHLFGQNEQFNEEIAKRMKDKTLEDLKENRKEEYMSEAGIAILFDRSGGKLTEKMCQVITAVKTNSNYHQLLIDQIRDIWNHWDAREEQSGDNSLEFDSFYGAFMAPYISCYRCPDAKQTLQAIDMNSDGLVDWNEFMVYIKWALNEYPEVRTADEVLSIAFLKGIIPAMRDEKINNQKDYIGFRHVLSHGLSWIPSENKVPKDAVTGGWDSTSRENLYIGRVKIDGSFVVGTIQAAKNCIVSYRGSEMCFTEYEVLVNPDEEVSIEWVSREEGRVPERAVKVSDHSDKIYYVGQATCGNDTIPGSVSPNDECIFVASKNELSKKQHKVLITK